jgi:hypothetical protein
MSWQLNAIADEVNLKNRIRTYTDYYSQDGTLQGALDGIIKAKEQVEHDKKMIAYAKKKYKPILDIYNEMKSIEKKAYLYEYNYCPEYRDEYIRYRSLTRRLKKNYNKEVFEVAAFLKECDERTLYAKAQLNELSEEYREIKKYGLKSGEVVKSNEDLLDVIGYYKDKENEKINVFDTSSFFIASKDSDTIINVSKSFAATADGRVFEKYTLTAMDHDGNVIETLTNSDGRKGFYNELREFQQRHGMDSCKRFDNFDSARNCFSSLSVIKDSLNVNKEQGYGAKDYTYNKAQKEVKSFTSAINHVSDTHPMSFAVDIDNPNYVVASSYDNGSLKLEIFDSAGNSVEDVYIPSIKNKNSSGYSTIVKTQTDYGFSSDVYEYDNLADALDSIARSKEKYKYENHKEGNFK